MPQKDHRRIRLHFHVQTSAEGAICHPISAREVFVGAQFMPKPGNKAIFSEVSK